MSAGARAIAGAARTKPHTGRAFLLTVSVVAAVGGFLFGFDTGVVSGALLYVRDDFGSLSSFQQDAVVSGTLLGAAIGAIFGGRAADRFGRRPLLLGSLASMVVSLVLLGLAFQLSALGSAVQWLAVLFLVTYVASFAIGLGPVFWLLTSEIYPLRIRGEAMSVASSFNWLANFAVGLTFLNLIDALGRPGTFWLYAGIGVLAIVFTYALVPETKDRSLEEIEKSQLRTVRRPFGLRGSTSASTG